MVFIIGFAFRDPSLNAVFDTALKISDKAKFYCYNPSEISDLPKESRIQYFTENFKNFHHIISGISLDENPLNFDIIEAKKISKKLLLDIAQKTV